MNQRKCPICGKWNGVNELTCSECNAVIDPKILAVEELEIIQKELELERLAKQTKLEKWYTKFKHSESPLHQLIYFIGSTIVTIYMAFISFFIWLIALISG
jgi:hypothetical protein